MSYVLRHQPDSIGLTLDREGWADIASLIATANKAGKRLDRALIETVVATSDKKRFAISEDGLRIRAVQGHSTDSVDISYAEKTPRARQTPCIASRPGRQPAANLFPARP